MTVTASRAGESAERHVPTYSLGGDSRRSERTLTGRPGAFSSSVLLVSTISLSSVEMTCCCFRGFFLGEAPGIRSPGTGAPRAEAAAVAAWPDDKLGLASGSEQCVSAQRQTTSLSVISSDDETTEMLNVVEFIVVVAGYSSINYVAIDRTDWKVIANLELLKGPTSSSHLLSY